MAITVTLLLTFGITENCSNGIKSRHHMLRHFSHADVLYRFERIVAGTICFLLITRIANPNRRIPISARHAFRFRRALRAKTLSTIAAMMFVVCRTKCDFALIAVFYFIVRSPIRWCHLIRGPGFQRFRWLQRNIRDGFSDVWNAIDNSLRCILRSYRTIRLKENRMWKSYFIEK